MNRIAVVLLTIAALSPGCLAWAARPEAKDTASKSTASKVAPPKKDLEAAYVTYDKAVKGGMAGMQKWCADNLAPDYTMVFLDGNSYTRKQYLEMLDRLVQNPAPAWKDIRSQKTRIKKLEVQSGDVIALVDIETVYDTKNPKRRQIALERPYKETWTRVGDSWKVKKSEELEPKPPPTKKAGPDRGNRPSFPNPRGGMPRGPYRGGPGYGYPGG